MEVNFEPMLAQARTKVFEALTNLQTELTEHVAAIEPEPPVQQGIEPASLLATTRQFAASATQVEILNLLIDLAAEQAPRVLLLIRKAGNLHGWAGRGFDQAAPAALKKIRLAIDAYPELHHVVEEKQPLITNFNELGALGEAIHDIDQFTPFKSNFFPILVKGRVAAVLYADSGAEAQLEGADLFRIYTYIAGLELTMVTAKLKVAQEGETTRLSEAVAKSIPKPAAPEPPAPQTPAAAEPTAVNSQITDSATPAFATEPATPDFPPVEPPAPEPTPEPAVPEFPQADFATTQAIPSQELEARAAAMQETPSFDELPSMPSFSDDPEPPAQPRSITLSEIEPTKSATPEPGGPLARKSDEDPNIKKAKRVARVLVSDIKLYNENAVAKAKTSGNLYATLREDIDRSYTHYRERVDSLEFDKSQNYFKDELIRQLGDGNPDVLGALPF